MKKISIVSFMLLLSSLGYAQNDADYTLEAKGFIKEVIETAFKNYVKDNSIDNKVEREQKELLLDFLANEDYDVKGLKGGSWFKEGWSSFGGKIKPTLTEYLDRMADSTISRLDLKMIMKATQIDYPAGFPKALDESALIPIRKKYSQLADRKSDFERGASEKDDSQDKPNIGEMLNSQGADLKIPGANFLQVLKSIFIYVLVFLLGGILTAFYYRKELVKVSSKKNNKMLGSEGARREISRLSTKCQRKDNEYKVLERDYDRLTQSFSELKHQYDNSQLVPKRKIDFPGPSMKRNISDSEGNKPRTKVQPSITNINEIDTQPKIIHKETRTSKYLYFRSFAKDVMGFNHCNASTESERKSRYEIYTIDENVGDIVFLFTENEIPNIISNSDMYFPESLVKLQNDATSTPTKIDIIKKGKVNKNGDVWKVTDKIQIKFS